MGGLNFSVATCPETTRTGSCTSAKITTLMNWADAQTPEIGYWAWSGNPFGCTSGPSLIKNDSFTPTSTYGSGFETHLQSVQ
jgi:endoglucanase